MIFSCPAKAFPPPPPEWNVVKPPYPFTVGAPALVFDSKGTLFACVGTDSTHRSPVYRSTDIERWISYGGPTGTNPIERVACGKDTIVSISGSSTYTKSFKWDSSNQYTYFSDPTTIIGRPRDICYGDGKFVAIGNNSAAYTTDGTTWTKCGYFTVEGQAIAYGNGEFLALGDSDVIIMSSDGAFWEPAPMDGDPILGDNESRLMYGNGTYVLVNKYNSKPWYYSGKQGWTSIQAPNTSYITDVAFGDGRFVAVGPKDFLMSEDGIKWESLELPPITGSLSTRRVTVGNGLIVVATDTEIAYLNIGGTTLRPTLISFRIGSINYQALAETSFGEWVDSPYNIDGCYVGSDGYIRTANGRYVVYPTSKIPPTQIIVPDRKYEIN